LNTQTEQTNAQAGQLKPAEKSEIQKHYPVHEPATPEESWEQFASGVIAQGKEGEATGEKAPGPKDKEPKGKQGFETEGQGAREQTANTELQQRQNQAPQQAAYDRMLERASKEPDFDKVVERLHEPFFPMNQEGYAKYQTMAYAMSQVSNADDVLYFLARPENSSVALKMQNAPPHKIAQTIHTISAELRFGGRTAKREEEPKPRAPKVPAEVGGRGAMMGDRAKEAARSGNFPDFSREMDERAARSRR
jgi:hypothetical protein